MPQISSAFAHWRSAETSFPSSGKYWPTLKLLCRPSQRLIRGRARICWKVLRAGRNGRGTRFWAAVRPSSCRGVNASSSCLMGPAVVAFRSQRISLTASVRLWRGVNSVIGQILPSLLSLREGLLHIILYLLLLGSPRVFHKR